jgi:hypothetical protein
MRDNSLAAEIVDTVIAGLAILLVGALCVAALGAWLGLIPLVLVTAFSAHPVLSMPEWGAIFGAVVYGLVWLAFLGSID